MAEETVETLTAKLEAMGSKVEEFRDNNVALTQALEKFGEVSPDDVAEAAEIKKQRDRKELLDLKDLDKALDEQEKRLTGDFEARFEAIKAEGENKGQRLRLLEVVNPLTLAATAAGVREDAIEDVVNQLAPLFEVLDGSKSPVRVIDGKPVLSAQKAGENEGLGEFFENYATQKPFFFDGSGGGGEPGETKRTPAGVRTITKEQFQSGKFGKEITDGTVRVSGYEEDVTTAIA